ncbi:NAD(P)-binding domain-containing protein [Roseicella aerolata]|uniref:NAD(P)-binding domain-containing protein n=1 Tax=Roseicella aerolata TaxID=2883479 RepID=A0A9X1LAF1_9PROT|nr:NAD(P)-binding domain-containing protein [Roseicella aerolata]MCB4821347.1 NAD(P)-binding domain-containing protein [Roseicella aerolata]
MQRSPVVIIGAGQAGLAMSHCLAARGVAHVVLERGRIGERWRSERWDSLRLLTPNWMARLPGWSYRGAEPDGFMAAGEFARHLEAYAAAMRAPVEPGVTVQAVRRGPHGYRVATSRGLWEAEAVVIATGHCDRPAIPAWARALPAGIRQVTTADYRNPSQLPEGGVLVVGASASGVQLAEEIQRSGRQVHLSVGRHTRLPRHYRGRDIWHWLDRSGLLDERVTQVCDLLQARRQPSFQLVGRPEGGTIDLGTLQAEGVRLLGRASGAVGGVLQLEDGLRETVAAAQQVLLRLLARIDGIADAEGAPREPCAAPRIAAGAAPGSLDLAAEGIGSVVWAGGFRRDYRWLQVPVLDAGGEIIHRGGVTPEAGLFVLGLRFMRRRRSNLIDGVGQDAAELAEAILGHLVQPCRAAA